MADWLPNSGALSPLDDGELSVMREGDELAYRLTVAGHIVTVAAEPAPGPRTILLPVPSSGRHPHRADGELLPPFDEAAHLSQLPAVAGADLSGLLRLHGSPFAGRGFAYQFAGGRLHELRLVQAPPRIDAASCPDYDIVWETDWDRWRMWRAGHFSGEQFLEGAKLIAQWPYMALVQGLFEWDSFVEFRRALAAPAPDLALLRLLDW